MLFIGRMLVFDKKNSKEVYHKIILFSDESPDEAMVRLIEWSKKQAEEHIEKSNGVLRNMLSITCDCIPASAIVLNLAVKEDEEDRRHYSEEL